MNVRIVRVEESDQGTLGVLVLDGAAFCCTLEPPDRDNTVNRSCIPAGTYWAMRKKSPKFGDTFEIKDVPGRSHILFHPGNVVKDTAGCILLGQHFGKLKGARAVLNSGRTFQAFMERAGKSGAFELEIIETLKN